MYFLQQSIGSQFLHHLRSVNNFLTIVYAGLTLPIVQDNFLLQYTDAPGSQVLSLFIYMWHIHRVSGKGVTNLMFFQK